MYYGNPYMPVMYTNPYQPFPGPYPGQMLYRPPFYQAVPGKGSPRGVNPKQHAGYRVRVPQQSSLPVQRDDEDRASSESPKPEPQPEKPGHTPPSGPRKEPGVRYTGQQVPVKKGSQKRVVAVPVAPRMPMYQPYFAYPHYIMPPEDPRYAAMGVQPPYYYQYGNLPRQPYPYMIPHPVQVQMQTRPGSGSVSPASSSEGASRTAHTGSPTGEAQTGNQSLSPGSSSSQHIQLLPNVKHVPSHLLYSTPGGSGNNSRSSTPVLANSPVPTQQQQQQQQLPNNIRDNMRDSPRNSQSELEFPSFRKRQHSGPRPVSQSPSYSSQSSHESSTSPVLNGSETTHPLASMEKPSVDLDKQPIAQPSKIADKAKRQLKLNTNTGFSRQFSDELGTPTEITNIVRMIEENIDEVDEEEEASRTADLMFRREAFHQSKPSPPTGKLYLHLAQSSEEMEDYDPRVSYAGALQHIPPYREKDFDPAMLEPQTPMTPAGFQTPGTDQNTDPLEILRHLTINSDNLNRSTHGHFQ